MQVVKITELALAHPSTIYILYIYIYIDHNPWQTFEASESLTKSCVGGGQRRHGGMVPSGPTWRPSANSGKERAELVVQMNAEAVQRIFGREMDAEAI